MNSDSPARGLRLLFESNPLEPGGLYPQIHARIERVESFDPNTIACPCMKKADNRGRDDDQKGDQLKPPSPECGLLIHHTAAVVGFEIITNDKPLHQWRNNKEEP